MTTNSNPMADSFRDAWEAYAEIWKLVGSEAKREACESRLDPACVYTDPATQRRGWDDLIAYMVEFHDQVPGGHFVTTEFMTHHDRSIANWNMVAGDGTVVGTGVSYGEYAVDGKVKTMTGFFDSDAADS